MMTLKQKLYIMTYRSYPYAWIHYCTYQYLLTFFETKNWKIPSKFDFGLEFSTLNKIFLVWIQSIEMYLWYFLKNFIVLIHWSYYYRVMFWTLKVSFSGEMYLHLLNNRIFVERSFENLHFTNLSKVM
jgi:hypothetical protein